MLTEVRAAGFLLFRRKEHVEFLLLQASYRDHHWSPPKGHVENGEDDLTAAYRETSEEAGINRNQICIQDFKEQLHYSVDGKPKIVSYWLAELIDKDFQVTISHEAQDYKWAEINEACRLAHFPDMQALLTRAYEHLSKK
ncbi:purine phosphoribosyltransferase family protein Apf [Rhodnius prolixus]|uniref:Bis(5'-nucleosyl)-tetraphosphatase [asymmetrical] n=1 Tax=Rhodnius prolixus TaxID=13249 RepID=R4FKG9_RHOPR